MKTKIRIAVIAPALPCEFFDRIWQGIWSATCELAPFGVKTESFETAGHDISEQRQILRNLLGYLQHAPPAALVLIPAHPTDLDREIDQIVALGIPVITFHADAPASRRHAYVGTDPAQSGALAGELLAKMMHGTGTVLSFPGSSETDQMARRYLAFRHELKRHAPSIQESLCHGGFAGLAAAANRTFSSGLNIGGIYVGSSRIPLVAEAMERNAISVPCVGFDDLPATRSFLKSGIVSAVIDESPYRQGYLALQQAYEATGAAPASGLQSEKSDWVRISPRVVFSANAQFAEETEAYNGASEGLIRRRTQKLAEYQRLLDEANARIVCMADTDPLTGLMNRRRFEEILDIRSRDQEKLSLLIIGMNGCARTLTGAGNQVSDEALVNVARVLSAELRPDDYCARLGGDEFGILMPGAKPAQASEVRQRILQVLQGMLIAPQTLKLNVHASIGLASMPADAQNAEDLLVLADTAMCAHRRSSFIRKRIRL